MKPSGNFWLAGRREAGAAKVYFAVEVRYVFGKRVDPTDVWRIAVPMYLCHSGVGAEAQGQEAGCFLITDAKGRAWFCWEIKGPNDPTELTYAEQFFRMGYLAHKIGINEGGSMFHGNANNLDDLREQLSATK